MKKILVFVSISFLLIAYFFTLKPKEEIQIGFVGSLTGKYSIIGNAVKNGVLLALNEENYEAGDKKIKILFRDDKNDSKRNEKIINEFIQKDIRLIIGNVTSTMTKESFNIVNEHKDVLLISASATSSDFSNKDDNFLRVQVSDDEKRFDSYTEYFLKKNYKKIYAIYDPKNKVYTKNYLNNFEKNFISKGGEKFAQTMTTTVHLNLLAQDIKKVKPDIVLISANAVDSAKILQFIRLKNIDTKVALSEWSMNPSFLQNAGKTANGVLFNMHFDPNSQSNSYKEFLQKYKNVYGVVPNMYAVNAYDLGKVLVKAIKVSKNKNYKEVILDIKTFKGIQEDIIFNKFGDVEKNFKMFTLENKMYVRVK